MSLRLGDPGKLTPFRPHGRTPVLETGAKFGIQNGRDHNPHGFSLWLAGGGVKGGFVYGATDDFGFQVADVTGKVIREILA